MWGLTSDAARSHSAAPKSYRSFPRIRRERETTGCRGRLHLSVKTVANYVSNLIVKLGTEDRADAIRLIRDARD
jgi:hypothetical protein